MSFRMTRRALVLAAALCVPWGFPAPRPQAPPAPATVVIQGATVIDGTDALPAIGTVILRDGMVAAILPADAAVPDGAQVIDGRGRYLIPGLWDMHVHLATRPEPQIAERIMLPLFVAHGIVGVRDMGGPPDRVLALRAQPAAGLSPAPRIITPGPFLDGPGDDDPLFRRILSSTDAAATVRDLSAAGVDFFKVQSGLTAEAHAALARAARARQAVFAGHVPLAMTAAAVADSGQRSIEHISPALVGDAGLLFACSPRETALRTELLAIERDRPSAKPGEIAAREHELRRALVQSFDPARARMLGARLQAAGVWIVPTLVWSNSLRPFTPADDGSALPMEYVPAATRTRWMEGRRRFMASLTAADFTAAREVARVSAEAVVALHEGGAAVLAGTDTMDAFVLPGISLHQELALLVRAGLTPLAALQSATLRAAEYRGTAAIEGSIMPGRRADLVLLDADPLRDIANLSRVRAVIIGGRVHARPDLDALLAQTRTAAQ